MPFSFIDIEERKTRIIGAVFFFVILFYFVTAWLVLVILYNGFLKDGFHWPGPHALFLALIVAFFAGFLHWAVSTSNLIQKLSLSIGAVDIDEKDIYHKNFKNVIDEVSVAIGGRRIEGMVIPSVGLNAFALEDFNGQAVIGVTEGLLARLNRAELEAVVGHEAGHIASGDCLSTSVTCAVGELYDETFSRLKAGLQNTRGRGNGMLLALFFVIMFMRFLSIALRYFISRQKEYRADALSVRLTRDPLSLARALSLVSNNWRGGGAEGEKLESIFIINPRFNGLDEKKGLFADMFSTHPPVKERIGILCDMAHLDPLTMEEGLKKTRRVSPVAKAEFSAETKDEQKTWYAFIEQQWKGPFSPDELEQLRGFLPDTWVRSEGSQKVTHAYENENLLPVFSKKSDGTGRTAGQKHSCPVCRLPLNELYYEGVSVLKCGYCEGVFLPSSRISRILIRTDHTFSPETVRLAGIAIKQREARTEGLYRNKQDNAWVFDCPNCGKKMRRQFFVYSYPVEIDRCPYCEGVWFDRQELEILQYIYENKEKFFDQGAF